MSARLAAIFLFTALLGPAAAHADVYSWLDEQGRLHYGDRPPVDVPFRRLDDVPISVIDGTRLREGEQQLLDDLAEQRRLETERAKARALERQAAANARPAQPPPEAEDDDDDREVIFWPYGGVYPGYGGYGYKPYRYYYDDYWRPRKRFSLRLNLGADADGLHPRRPNRHRDPHHRRPQPPQPERPTIGPARPSPSWSPPRVRPQGVARPSP